MTVGMIAFHYPEPAHFEDFVARVGRVAEAFRATPGCLHAECWVTADNDAVVSTVHWESDAARAASFTTVMQAHAADVTFDERERRAREIITMMPAGR